MKNNCDANCNAQIKNLQNNCQDCTYPDGTAFPATATRNWGIDKPPCTTLYTNKKKILNQITTNMPIPCTPDQITDLWNNIERCTWCSPGETNNSGLSNGAIAGIVIGSVIGLALSIFLIYKYKHKRK